MFAPSAKSSRRRVLHRAAARCRREWQGYLASDVVRLGRFFAPLTFGCATQVRCGALQRDGRSQRVAMRCAVLCCAVLCCAPVSLAAAQAVGHVGAGQSRRHARYPSLCARVRAARGRRCAHARTPAGLGPPVALEVRGRGGGVSSAECATHPHTHAHSRTPAHTCAHTRTHARAHARPLTGGRRRFSPRFRTRRASAHAAPIGAARRRCALNPNP
jgi:hypothetical protein